MDIIWLQRGEGPPVEVHSHDELVRLMVDGYHQVPGPATAAPTEKETEK